MIETVPSGTILHGRYRVERVLGSGGFGHVYLGMDLATNQQYALKEYLVTGASAQEQLKHEATVLSQLHHPHLPAFLDAFIERGRYYVVLNYIEGNDLTDIIRIARQHNDVVPIGLIMGWLLSICDAVMFLHAQQPPVIHRDIKPDNIRITSNGTALLVDLGNAKAAADGARTLFFIRHQGTPGYAPPEQYPGGSGTDTRSDVYALGGTLYFALTAHEPPSVSTRNQAVQQGQPDLPTLQERLASNPPEVRPEENPVRQFRLGVTKPAKPAPRHSKHVAQLGTLPPELLRQLDRIIQRAMALKPKDRYQYVADFANDLKGVMRALPSPLPPTPPPGTAPRPSDLNSTQPDLPMLYEALQSTKDPNNQGGPGTQNAFPSSLPGQAAPMSSPAGSSCPRCNAPINPQAAFCPRCGAALGGANVQNRASSPGNINVASEDATMIVTPPGKFVQTAMADANRASAASNPASLSGNSVYSGQQMAPMAQVPLSRNNATLNGNTPQKGATNGSASSQPDVDIRLFIALIVVVVVLVAIAIVLLIR
jgi:serine/threonine protein kinase